MNDDHILKWLEICV